MATKHRKLFPETNQTTACLDFCDTTCPYNCYVYSEPWFPPPPPSSSSSPPPLSLNTPDQNDSPSPSVSPYVIITVGLIAGFFLLASYYAIIIKYCSVWRRRSRPPPSGSDAGDEEFLDENRGPEIDHHIWYIATVGLQQAIINSITVCKYKRGEGLIEGTECSVCLSEFQEDETLRLLPKCNHAFHIPCIDTWLRSHTNCPLCRARIVAEIVNPLPQESTDHQNEQTQMENSGSETELASNQDGIGGTGELQIQDDDRNSKEGVNSNGNGDIILQVNENSGTDSEIQAVRRSVSVDSSSATTIFAGLADFQENEYKGNRVKSDSGTGNVSKREVACTSKMREMGSPSMAQCLRKTPVSMKRSFSCGGRFFLPRNNRSANAILPL